MTEQKMFYAKKWISIDDELPEENEPVLWCKVPVEEPPEGFPLLSVRKLLDDYKQLESAQAGLQSLIRETLIEKAELESLINDERRKYNMNREEFESVQNANGEYIHTLKESLDNERTWRKQAESKLPEELFGGYAVYNETKFAAPMIAPDDVSIVLDAVVKLIKQRVSAKPKGEL